MKMSNKNKFISGLLGVAMCPMMLPTAAFAADDGAASEDSSSPTELIQSSESEGTDTGARSGDTPAAQSELTGEAANATTGKEANEAAPVAETGGEVATASVAEVDGKNYSSLQEAINAAQDGETVTLRTNATEDVTIAGKNITLDLGGNTLTNTSAGKATLTIAKGATATVKNGNIFGGTGYYTIDNYGTATLEDVTATAGNTDSSMIRNDGTLTIESGSYSGGLNVVKSEEDSTLTINGGKFELSYATSGYTGVVFAYGNTTITGGEFIQSLTTTGRWNYPQVIATGVVKGHTAITRVTGGYFVNKLSRESIFRGIGKGTSDNFEVSGGTFNKSISEGYCADGFIPTKNADGTYGVKEGSYVAQIGSKKYETLADAIRMAAKGKTITLLTDVEQNTQLAINKDITLDLNGKTIKNTVDIWGDNANAILSITNGAKVTITGNGTIDAKENDCYTINVKKGDLTIENGTFYGNVSVVQVQEGTLSVKGGTFDLHQKWEGSSKYLFNCIDDAYANGSANVAVSGGTFVGFDPNASPEGEGTSYLAPGYAPVANADGTYGVVAGVAQIGSKAYATLADAVAAAKDGDTITLLSDCSGDGISVNEDTFPNGLTIDFAGHSYTVGGKLVGSTGTASNGFQLLKGNTIVMRNGSIYGDASVAGDDTTQWSGSPAIMIQNYSNLTLDGMTVKGGKQTCYTLSNNNGDTVIKDSTIIAGQNTQVGGPFAFDVCRYASYPSVSITVEGNSVIDGCVDVSGTIGEGQSRQLTITGGTFSKPISVSTLPANVSISGGTFANEVPADYCAAGYVPAANADGTYGVEKAVAVTFDSNEGTAVDSQLVPVGHKVTKPADPTKEGYTFSGWFTDEDCTNAYDFDAAVDGTQPEFTLYAGWKAAPATVEPGAGDNGNNGDTDDNGSNGDNGDGSSVNANVNVNTVNNNGDNASSEAKMATVKTGDNLALVGGAIAVIAVAAAGVAVFALRRRKMN